MGCSDCAAFTAFAAVWWAAGLCDSWGGFQGGMGLGIKLDSDATGAALPCVVGWAGACGVAVRDGGWPSGS